MWNDDVHVTPEDTGSSGGPLMLLIVALWLVGVLVALVAPPVGILLLILALVVSFGAGSGGSAPSGGKDYRRDGYS